MCHMARSYVCHDSFTCVAWLVHTCDMTRSYVWHVLFICATCLIHMCDMTHSHVWHDSFICVTWHIHMSGTPYAYVWHDSFTCVTWLIHMCDMTHSYVWRDSFTAIWAILRRVTSAAFVHHSFIRMTWPINICDMIHMSFRYVPWLIYPRTHSYVWHVSFVCVTWLIHTYEERHESSIGVQRDMTHPHVACLICMLDISRLIAGTWLIWRDMTHLEGHDSFGGTWLIYCMRNMTRWYDTARFLLHPRTTYSHVWLIPSIYDSFVCNMTCHSYAWHDPFICVTWPIHMRDMTHSYAWHDPFICVTWPIYMCDITHSCNMTHWYSTQQSGCTQTYKWHDSFRCGNDSLTWNDPHQSYYTCV